MNVLSSLVLVDETTTASHPGKVSIRPWRYALHFPFWPTVLGSLLLGCVLMMFNQPGLLPITSFVALVNVLYWVRVRVHFGVGCTNPGKVLSTQPFLLGIYTDLKADGDSYPAIKILEHPQPKGCHYEPGQNCASVSLYSGAAKRGHWKDFAPVMVDCATADAEVIGRTVESIPSEEWSNLEKGLGQLPKPLKAGVYPINLAK
jgi:Protein of unknown function (DUF3239)